MTDHDTRHTPHEGVPRPRIEATPSMAWPAARRQAPPASPRLSGRLLAAVHRIASLPGGGALVRAVAERSLGIDVLRALPDSFRGALPDETTPHAARASRRWSDARLGTPTDARGTATYAEAYRRGASPLDVAEAAIDVLMGLHRQQPSMNVLAAFDPDAVRREARTSHERWRRGTARRLEGIPFLVKDQHDVADLATRFGASHSAAPALRDATIVARLRDAGAVVLGKTVMTEWGMSPIGASPHHAMPRNAHAPDRAAGGSSTGSAVAVALGLGPFATGGDAGGSVRLPAAFAGVQGLKPTFGRISRHGEAFAGSLNHLGLLARCAADLAALLDVTSGEPDPADPLTRAAQVDGSFGTRLGDGVRGLRIGIEATEWADCEPELSRAAREALAALERDGAVLVPVRVPLAQHAAAIGVATMAGEGSALAKTASSDELTRLGLDSRLALQVASGVSAGDYLDVQRLRVALRRQTAAALRQVDVLALPVSPITAPTLGPGEHARSFSDGALIAALCRHTFWANLTGTPALSVPVGIDSAGVPIGLQIVGDAWDEAAILAVAAHLERAGVSRCVAPRGFVDLLERAGRARS